MRNREMLPYEKTFKIQSPTLSLLVLFSGNSHHVSKDKNSENTVTTLDTSTAIQKGQISFSKSVDAFRTNHWCALLRNIKHKLSSNGRFSEISVGCSKFLHVITICY